MSSFPTVLQVPDLWQQKAVNLLRSEHDVVVDAPTGAGKTFIFEHLVERAFPGKAVYTVPTRALANDKLREWQEKGWHVGIETGDLSLHTDAPIVIATLETQKRALITGSGPKLLVIDEYQMIGDPTRGVNYELAIAMAPKKTQLLLLSGSVSNTHEIVKWLQRCGRNAVSVVHRERPVPLDEVHLNALPDRIPKNIHGRWPRFIARALEAGLGPILIFAPRRKSAESLARTLASALAEPNPITLTPEQKAVAGNELSRCLKQRIAYHHSGMSYGQRAGVVEALAKHNQLKVIVATTGLAAGINFSMRSVLVLDREYRVADGHRLIRPDELLQMFGRAGRRGLDTKGSVLYLEGKPRLAEARQTPLKREGNVDWPSLITLIQSAVEAKQSPLKAVRSLTTRLFSKEMVPVGLEDFLKQTPPKSRPVDTPARIGEQALSGGIISEFQNSEGIWERKRAPVPFPLKDTWFLQEGTWRPGLSSPKIVSSIRLGTIYKYGKGADRRYGIEAPIATFPVTESENRLTLSKWLRRALREHARANKQTANVPKLWTLEAIERRILPQMPSLSRGGRHVELSERSNTLYSILDYSEAQIDAFRDQTGKGLLNPLIRKREVAGTSGFIEHKQRIATPRSIAEHWYALDLIDKQGRPTRRGILFSFFNHGEGLAIAAGLEAKEYPIEELYFDLANIRAGHRFNALALAGRPLTAICQSRYGLRSVPGYLRRGVPEDYGEGASEILYNIHHGSSRAEAYLDEELSHGDIERASVEWRSLRIHIAHAPDYDWDRWNELREQCRRSLENERPALPFENLPPLTRQQRTHPPHHKPV